MVRKQTRYGWTNQARQARRVAEQRVNVRHHRGCGRLGKVKMAVVSFCSLPVPLDISGSASSLPSISIAPKALGPLQATIHLDMPIGNAVKGGGKISPIGCMRCWHKPGWPFFLWGLPKVGSIVNTLTTDGC